MTFSQLTLLTILAIVVLSQGRKITRDSNVERSPLQWSFGSPFGNEAPRTMESLRSNGNSKRDEAVLTATLERATLCPNVAATTGVVSPTGEMGTTGEEEFATGSGSTGGFSTTGMVSTGSSFIGYSVCNRPSDSIADGTKNYQQKVVYNSNRNEYFAVFIQEDDSVNPPKTSILGIRMDINGAKIGNPIPIYTYDEDHSTKHNPDVAYNSISDRYLVVFDYETDDPYRGHDIGGFILESDGSIARDGFYIGKYNDTDETPHAAFAPTSETFLVVWQHTFPNGTKVLYFQSLLANGDFISYAYLAGDGFNTQKPQVIYDADLDYFLVIFEETKKDIDIAAIQIDSYGSALGGVVIVGATVITYDDDTPPVELRDHNAQVVFNPVEGQYFLLWEVDLEGEDVGPTNVVGGRIDQYNLFLVDGDYVFVLGIEANVPYNRNPSIAYGSTNNEYLVAYEAFIEGQSVSSIRASFITPNLDVINDIPVSDLTADEHFPSIAYSSSSNTQIILWNHGTVTYTYGDTTTGSGDDVKKTKSSNAGVVAGAVIGVIVGLAFIGGVAFILVRRFRSPKPTKFNEMHDFDSARE